MMADIQDEFLPWPLPPGAEAYADIDGRRMHADVVEQAQISRRYRDQVHPKFWGRIIGSSSDAESAEWLAGQVPRRACPTSASSRSTSPRSGSPQDYQVTVASGGKTVELDSAQPFYGSADRRRAAWIWRPSTSGSAARPTSPGRTSAARRCSLQHASRRRTSRRRHARAGRRAPRRSSTSTCCRATCATRPIPPATQRPVVHARRRRRARRAADDRVAAGQPVA